MDEQLAHVLVVALRDNIEKLEAMSLGIMMPNTDYVVRQNDKRPAKISLFIPDDWAMNIKNNPKLQDAYVFMRIPREVVEVALKPEPKIVTPYDYQG